jgi:hypothetical protein
MSAPVASASMRLRFHGISYNDSNIVCIAEEEVDAAFLGWRGNSAATLGELRELN